MCIFVPNSVSIDTTTNLTCCRNILVIGEYNDIIFILTGQSCVRFAIEMKRNIKKKETQTRLIKMFVFCVKRSKIAMCWMIEHHILW